MLLLMLNANFNDRRPLPERCIISIFDETGHLLINILTIGKHLPDRRARNSTAPGTTVRHPCLQIIGIEKIAVLRMLGGVPTHRLFQQKYFEKPRGMCKVPLGGACIFGYLNHIIFNFKGLCQQHGISPHLLKSCCKCLAA